jgi:hypothetical protein
MVVHVGYVDHSTSASSYSLNVSKYCITSAAIRKTINTLPRNRNYRRVGIYGPKLEISCVSDIKNP